MPAFADHDVLLLVLDGCEARCECANFPLDGGDNVVACNIDDSVDVEAASSRVRMISDQDRDGGEWQAYLTILLATALIWLEKQYS